ncbi:MAG: hypothetical protein ABI591_08700 [Kofleriaceae bacterium]
MADPPHVALGLLEDELAAELPSHMRAFARAHAEHRTPPPAPLVARLASTLETVLAALANEGLADRAVALLRLVAPFAIEDDPSVAAIRAQPPSWDGLVGLAAARDQASRARFGIPSIELVHRLHGTHLEVGLDAPDGLSSAIAGWNDKTQPLDAVEINDVWNSIATRLGLVGAVRIDRSAIARPRTFVIEPMREVIVVVPALIDSPAARFAVLHELGHAAAALVSPAGIPRVVDEAAASYVARLAEPPSWLPPRWASELAVAARLRRTALAAMLDDAECLLPALPQVPGRAPPWALWHDPGAQAAYVLAETIAERLRSDLGGNPPRGQFARALTAERDRIDRRLVF